ncbi:MULTISPECIES: mechanosensitive ion channel family protein [Stutzerimonas]|jgi:small-conductance mechanosensitive channel|uniref:Small-conductance mechanosensitive channel n=1 Tax=Stutzerimonas balearica TaxID=74829 RepID=A0A9X7V848_9GAMM|nr:mechanosensitive ion channel family protein [Stutzerimonas balearica]MBB63130.1 mechanosensitive ion channel family protein [Pseudomonas sp.]WIX03355.1 mechanosensitive ion channel family protein [Pseudomonas sp. AR5]MBC7198735.1 mechanosensitive ion channel family protein [Stutzerimonas balearica]MBD3735202.1 mechanosensitive ion channel family protein [Stutzerimonas balearica]MBK3746815.1 mechanosensitive ion channel [Stutzerimonas balearica]|tara:strand:- start:1647 stop:2231 length:585 start_codon:yes stop_codon:yes gene_type:complete
MNEQLLNIAQEWRGPLLLAAQVLAILLGAYLLQRLVARALTRLSNRYPLPPELLLPVRGGIRWLIMGGALIMVLERFGVSAAVLWTAISGFVAVAAVAFFAIWSVLSNLLCAVLILMLGPFRLGDVVELVESSDKPIVKGRVIDINLLYTTLEEVAEAGTGALVQVPNSLFFQKAVRRWRGGEIPLHTQLPHEK